MDSLHDNIKKLKQEGKTNKEIAKMLGVSFHCVTYHVKDIAEKRNQRKQASELVYNEFKNKVKEVLPECNSYNEVCNKLGLKGVEGYYKKIKKVIEEEKLDISHFGTLNRNRVGCFKKISDDVYFANNTNRGGTNMLNRLIANGYKVWKCENPECNLSEWHGEKIPLQVHHINGIHTDNRIENLQLLCPNCHAMTENYSRKKHVGTGPFLREKKVNEMAEVLFEAEKEKKELFEAFLKYHSFVRVGKEYGVSDNAIRKRCKKLGILGDILRMKKN